MTVAHFPSPTNEVIMDIKRIEQVFSTDAEKEMRTSRLLARGYHEGKQAVYLNDRAKEYLELHTEAQFRMNIIQSINNALKDELNVKGFLTGKPEASKKQEQWAKDLWWKRRLDYLQSRVHETTMAEGECFVIVDYDETEKLPDLTFHRRYIEATISIEGNQTLTGDGMGVWMIYENNDIDQSPAAAVKQWVETYQAEDGKYTTRDRMTIYFPDRIERYAKAEQGWSPVLDDKGQFPIVWKDKSGAALGIPVIHFKNANFIPESWEAIPIQDAVNKTLVDMLGAADSAGFPMFRVFGFYPTTDGLPLAADKSNAIKIRPLSFLGSNKSPSEASLDIIPPSPATPLMDVITELVLFAAQITGTPTSRFSVTKQLAGADTLKQQDKTLIKKAKNRKVILGDAWEDCMRMARRLANVFGGEQMDEKVIFQTDWEKSETEVEVERAEEMLGMEKKKMIWDTVSTVVQSTQGAVSPETVLRDFGWTDAQLKDFGTQRMDWIRSQQEDVIPPETQ
jgi:hypothetical protein